MRLVLGALTLLAVAALAVLAIHATAGRAAATPFPPADRLELAYDPALTAEDRAWIASSIGIARTPARDLLVAVSGQVEIVLAGSASCPRQRVSCVRAGDRGDGRPVVVALQREHLDEVGTARGRFLVLHELAHAVDAAMLGDEGRRAFERRLRVAAGALPCSATVAQPGCIPSHDCSPTSSPAGRAASAAASRPTPRLHSSATRRSTACWSATPARAGCTSCSAPGRSDYTTSGERCTSATGSGGGASSSWCSAVAMPRRRSPER